MLQILDALNGDTYKKIIELLIKYSDSFIFTVPNMGKILVNKRNAKFMSEYPIGFSEEYDQKLHLDYINRIQEYINVVEDDIITTCVDTGYLDQISNLEIAVYHVAISEKSTDFFALTNDFAKWVYPEYPENPCFLLKNNCIFQSITHEDLYFLYLDNADVRNFLKRNNINYEEIKEKPPRFDNQ